MKASKPRPAPRPTKAELVATVKALRQEQVALRAAAENLLTEHAQLCSTTLRAVIVAERLAKRVEELLKLG